MPHTWDPDALPDVRRRARPPVRRAGRAGRRRSPRDRGRPRLRSGQPDHPPAPPLARGCDPGARLQPGDDRAGADGRRRRSTWRSPTSATGPRDGGDAGRRPGLQRHPPVGARPPRPAAGAGRDRGPPGGWFAFQVPGQLRRAEPHDPHRARRRGAVRRRTPAASPSRAATTPRSTSRRSPPSAAASTPGRRRTSTC